MKKQILILLILITSLAPLVSATHPSIESINVDPSSPNVGESFTVSVRAEDFDNEDRSSPGISYVKAELDGEVKRKNCNGAQDYSCLKDFDFEVNSADDYTIKVTAKDTEFLKSVESRTITVKSEATPPSVNLLEPNEDERNADLRPDFRWEDTSNNENVEFEFYIEEKTRTGDQPWSASPKDLDSGDSLSYNLKEDTWYVWGVEATTDQGETDREYRYFKTKDTDKGPTARFTYSPNNPEVEQWVNFDASNSDGDIEEYHWEFGDGDTYTDDDPKVRHRYNSKDEYTVELTVEEFDGDEHTKTKTVDVKAAGDDDDDNSAPEVELNKPSNNQEITLPYTLRWDVSDPDSDDVDSTVYIAEERNDESTLDDQYIIRENVESSERYRLDESDLDEGDYMWGVKATDENDATTWSNVRSFEVIETEDRDRNGNAYLDVIVEDEDGDPIRDAKVVADNENWFSQYTDSDGEVSFELQAGTVDLTVSKEGYRQETRHISLEAEEEEEVTITLSERDVDSDQARLDVHVEDDDYDSLEDAKVTVENGDDEIRYTGHDGDARFYLDSGDYDITVECNDEEEYRDTYLSEGEREDIDIRFDEDFDSDTCGEDDDTEGPADDDGDTDDGSDSDGIAITDVSYPNSVCRGGSFSVNMRIQNRGGFHELVTVTGSGLGSINTGQSFSLDIAETKSATLRFTNVEGSGTEEFDIRATNHVSDETTETINVRDCGAQLPDTDGRYYPSDRGTATGVTAELSPDQTVVGGTVKVKGYVDGVRGRTQVTIRANGQRKATVSTEPDGYYSTYIRLNELGENIVTVSSGQSETSGVVTVVPTSQISGIRAPDKVFDSETFEICSTIDSQIEPKVFLLKDGKIVDSKFGKGEVCFEKEASNPGEHEFQMKTLTYGKEGSSITTTVEVLDLGNEVTNFPNQIATVESESGMVKVELYNTHNDTRRYKVKLNGIRTTWLSQSQEDVILTKGERETVYFYLTPQEEGTFEPIVTVVSQDTTIYSEEISVYAGGTKNPRKDSFFDRLSQIFSL